mmetsp:Transcript_10055/g.17826  ORF Transcript_10055/g.17826 Transcript_10055/m.17826 type:complete len:339 (-) Transcript_10055:1507-2523(-)
MWRQPTEQVTRRARTDHQSRETNTMHLKRATTAPTTSKKKFITVETSTTKTRIMNRITIGRKKSTTRHTESNHPLEKENDPPSRNFNTSKSDQRRVKEMDLENISRRAPKVPRVRTVRITTTNINMSTTSILNTVLGLCTPRTKVMSTSTSPNMVLNTAHRIVEILSTKCILMKRLTNMVLKMDTLGSWTDTMYCPRNKMLPMTMNTMKKLPRVDKVIWVIMKRDIMKVLMTTTTVLTTTITNMGMAPTTITNTSMALTTITTTSMATARALAKVTTFRRAMVRVMECPKELNIPKNTQKRVARRAKRPRKPRFALTQLMNRIRPSLRLRLSRMMCPL